MLTFRDSIRKLSPRWLQRGFGEKILYAMAVQVDALGDGLVAGVKMRFPGLYSDESLPLIGRERRIRRGPEESSSSYATRLQRWLDDHATRGGPYAMLAQLFAYWAPSNFEIHLVYYSGRRFMMNVLGEVARDDISWTPDAFADKWARWWLIFFWPSALGDDGLWGDAGIYGDGGVWGSDLSAANVANVRAVPKEWNAGHAIGRVVLLPPDGELWGYPPGSWGDTGVWGGGKVVQMGIG